MYNIYKEILNKQGYTMLIKRDSKDIIYADFSAVFSVT